MASAPIFDTKISRRSDSVVSKFKFFTNMVLASLSVPPSPCLPVVASMCRGAATPQQISPFYNCPSVPSQGIEVSVCIAYTQEIATRAIFGTNSTSAIVFVAGMINRAKSPHLMNICFKSFSLAEAGRFFARIIVLLRSTFFPRIESFKASRETPSFARNCFVCAITCASETATRTARLSLPVCVSSSISPFRTPS